MKYRVETSMKKQLTEKRIRAIWDNEACKGHHSKYLELLEFKCKYIKT